MSEISTPLKVSALKNYLNRPFPYTSGRKSKIVLSIFFSGFVFIFLLTFKPFGIDDIPKHKIFFIAGFSFITFFIISLNLWVIPKFFKNYFNPDLWTIKKMISFIILQLLLISLFNWIYSFMLRDELIKQSYNLLEFLFFTFSVGIFPILFFIVIIELLLSKRNQEIAGLATDDIVKTYLEKLSQGKTSIKIGESPNLVSLDINNLVCIKSEGNYCELYLHNNTLIKRELIRHPLSKIAQKLCQHNNIKHCHRSFIVNFNYVNKVTGNARNYSLHIKHLDFTIPVSRSFSREFINRIKS